MVIVRIYDKRYHKGYNIKFFQTDTITEEIIQFVKGNPKAYWVESSNEFYLAERNFLRYIVNKTTDSKRQSCDCLFILSIIMYVIMNNSI